MSAALCLLDLFCGAGGAAMGYHRAGFEVFGVDNQRQPHYPFAFHRGDVIEVMARLLNGEQIEFTWPDGRVQYLGLADFATVHASPPCQKYTKKTKTWGRKRVHFEEHPDLIPGTREALAASGKATIMENVMHAPMRCDVMLCGTMFGLRIIKHRQFELNFPIATADLPPCGDHQDVYNPWSGKRSADVHRAAQGTPWIPQHGGASRKAGVTGDLNNAIPPAFTEWLGLRLRAHIELEKI